MAGTQVATGISIINSLSGFFSLSLTNFDNDSLPAIAAGSKVEVAGAFFSFNSETAISSTNWAGISAGNMAYIMLTASGTPGSQTLAASWSGTAPTWVDSKQGWYASAASSVRCIGGVYKYDATNYSSKFVLSKGQDIIRERYVSIGTWNMGIDAKDITYKAPRPFIIDFNCVIHADSFTYSSENLNNGYYFPASGQTPLQISINATYIRIVSTGSFYYSSSAHNDTSTDRGYVKYSYRII